MLENMVQSCIDFLGDRIECEAVVLPCFIGEAEESEEDECANNG